MQSITCNKYKLFLLFIFCFIIETSSTKIYAQNRLQWMYYITPEITEDNFIHQMNYLQEKNYPIIVMIDISQIYKKRILYLLGRQQQEWDFLVAVTNTSKSVSPFLSRDLYKQFQVNLIYEQYENILWFLQETDRKYNMIWLENEFASILDQLNAADGNKALIIQPEHWNENYLSSLKNHIEANSEANSKSALNHFEKSNLVIYDENDSLKWFNNIAFTVLSIFSLSIIIFVISIFLFRSWSKKRLCKKGGG